MVGRLWRSWRRAPLLTMQFVLTIAIGMGAVAAVFSLLLALGYAPLPFREPGQLVAVWAKSKSGVILAISGPDMADYAGGTNRALSSLGAIWTDQEYLLSQQRAEPVAFIAVDRATFQALGVRMILGRGVRQNDRPALGGGIAPAWISARLWQQHFGGRPSIIGQEITLALDAGGRGAFQLRIAGILPPGTAFSPVTGSSSRCRCFICRRRDPIQPGAR